MIIQTNRLGLRELTQDDFPALCKMLKDGETMRAYEGAFSDGEAHEWLDRQIARYKKMGLRTVGGGSCGKRKTHRPMRTYNAAVERPRGA